MMTMWWLWRLFENCLNHFEMETSTRIHLQRMKYRESSSSLLMICVIIESLRIDLMRWH